MKRQKILLVEDNLADRVLLRASLPAEMGLEVIEAETGESALEFFASWPGGVHPRIVLLDLGLPRMGGHEVLAHLRDLGVTSRLPVVVFTSSDDPSETRTSLELGARAHIRKPQDLQGLRDFLEDLPIYWATASQIGCSTQQLG